MCGPSLTETSLCGALPVAAVNKTIFLSCSDTTGRSARKPRYDCRPVCVGFVEDTVALRKICSKFFDFSRSVISGVTRGGLEGFNPPHHPDIPKF